MSAAFAIDMSAMTRGGRKKDRAAPERRCIATGESGGTAGLIRFVLSPDGQVVPDLASKLPGRGAWVTADRALVDRVVKKRLFSRAFRQPVEPPPDLAGTLEALLLQRLVNTIALARKAGQAVAGAEKVKARINSGLAEVLLQASDGAADGKAKIANLARAVGDGRIARIQVLTAAELGLAFGREFAIHAALDAGGFAESARNEAQRLSGMRSIPHTDGSDEDVTDTGPERTQAATGMDDRAAQDGGAAEQDD
ncbi:MAG: RNA-binding protein [Pseudomonadota bacterium]